MTDTNFPHWSERIEPLSPHGHDGPEQAALVSIAISLKRIADMMHGSPDRCGVLDSLANIADRMGPCG